MSDENAMGRVINFVEAKERLKGEKIKREIRLILNEELPEKDGYNDFGLAVTREEVIDRFFEFLFHNGAEDPVQVLRSQLSIDRDIAPETKRMIYDKLEIILKRCKVEINKE